MEGQIPVLSCLKIIQLLGAFFNKRNTKLKIQIRRKCEHSHGIKKINYNIKV